MKSFTEIKETLKEYQAGYLLNFYEELSEEERENFMEQIEKIDFAYMKELYESVKNGVTFETGEKEISPITAFDKTKLSEEEYQRLNILGESLIKDGKLAVCSMAGGQGTRLGYNGPKGTFMLDLDGKPTSIFETIIHKLKMAYEAFGVHIYWYVMTSRQNHAVTVKFFKDNNYFGYDKNYILFFEQGELPLIDKSGKVVMKDKSHIFMAPDGNGGIFKALEDKKILNHMREHGIEYLAVGNVDNILINMVDPVTVAVMKENQSEALSKVFMKPSPEGKWGVFCKIDGIPHVIEYSETPKELLEARNEAGELIYGDVHFGCNFFHINLLNRIASEKLPMHAASKKNKFLAENGAEKEEEVYKFEAFIFDAFTMANNLIVCRVKREEEFAPIKNKEGDESPETAVELYKKFYHQ